MDNTELEQLSNLLSKLTLYFNNISENIKGFNFDNMEEVNKYKDLINSMPLDKLAEVDNKTVEYFDAYSNFLSTRKYRLENMVVNG